MITLTTGPTTLTSLGGTGTVQYNKAVASSINVDVLNQIVSATITLTSTVDTSVAPLVGSFSVSIATSKANLSFPSLGFNRTITLGSTASVLSFIQSTQNTIESALDTWGLTTGVQSTGV